MKYFAAILMFCLLGQLHADVDPAVHPIDQQFAGKLEFMGTNREMVQNIDMAKAAWREELKKQEAILLKVLQGAPKRLFIDAQQKWEAALAADEAFFFHDSGKVRSAIGREGQIGAYLEFMQRIRARALELERWCGVFTLELD